MKHLLPAMVLLSCLLVSPRAYAADAVAPAFGARVPFNVDNFAGGVAPRGYIAERNAAAVRSWKRSLIPFVATQGLDIASSYGMRELNPLLAGPRGEFGAKAAGIKIGTTAAVLGVEYLIVKKWPAAGAMLSKLNWGSSALTGAFAAHNFAIK